MLRHTMRYGALVGAIALGACDLEVVNPNDPETERVLGSPTEAESMLGTQYLRWHTGLYGSTAVFWGMASGQSFENYSSLANNCQNQRNPIPRPINDNSIGNGCNGEQSRVYNIHNEVARVATTVLAQFDKEGYTLGSPARDARAKAYAQFLRGLSFGYIALFYDSSAVITTAMSSEDPGELVAYTIIADTAYAALQSAIDIATTAPAGGDGFPLPTSWLPSPTTFSAAEFVKLIRTYRARIRANMPRTPAEADLVDWAAVIADANGGITSDHLLTTNRSTGPDNAWVNQWYSYALWHQMPPFVIGMADVSGSYAAWIAQDLEDRGTSGPFFMVTPDLRFPQGGTRSAQQADFSRTSCQAAATVCKRYFENRPSSQDENVGSGWGWSNYNHVRFFSWRTSGDAGVARNGTFPFFTKAELDLLKAEAHIRRGEYDLAAPLINTTRTANGLPAITALDNTTPVPGGGVDCVPKVPVPPNYNTIACGNMMEAMKYEKRIETAYTHFAAWFLDMRRWGDLAEGTPLYWAVPYGDLQARGRPASAIYSTGTGQAPGSAASRGTYGW